VLFAGDGLDTLAVFFRCYAGMFFKRDVECDLGVETTVVCNADDGLLFGLSQHLACPLYAVAVYEVMERGAKMMIEYL